MGPVEGPVNDLSDYWNCLFWANDNDESMVDFLLVILLVQGTCVIQFHELHIFISHAKAQRPFKRKYKSKAWDNNTKVLNLVKTQMFTHLNPQFYRSLL